MGFTNASSHFHRGNSNDSIASGGTQGICFVEWKAPLIPHTRLGPPLERQPKNTLPSIAWKVRKGREDTGFFIVAWPRTLTLSMTIGFTYGSFVGLFCSFHTADMGHPSGCDQIKNNQQETVMATKWILLSAGGRCDIPIRSFWLLLKGCCGNSLALVMVVDRSRHCSAFLADTMATSVVVVDVVGCGK